LDSSEGMKRDRGRPKITLVEIVKKEMLVKEVIESMILDRIEWWIRIHMTELD
jgi:hypothetical protein